MLDVIGHYNYWIAIALMMEGTQGLKIPGDGSE